MANPTSKLNLVINGTTTQLDIHDANAVDLTSNQTVGGIKTFSNAPVVNSINLDGKTIDTDANGNLTFNGHIIDTIEEQGNGYIRYSNGLEICWTVEVLMTPSSHGTWTYPKAFISVPSVLWQAWGQDTSFFDVAGGGNITTSYAEFIPFRNSSDSYAPYGVSGLAIGLWK